MCSKWMRTWKNKFQILFLSAVIVILLLYNILQVDGYDMQFVQVQNDQIVDSSGAIYRIRGINITNNFWDDWGGNAGATTDDHNELSYQELSEMGFNTVRFLLNAEWFENNREATFKWLDKEIETAAKYDIKIIFNMHVLPGGRKENNPYFWNNETQMNQLVGIWQEIAHRYYSESNVLGYGLINEPQLPWKGNVDDSMVQYRDYIRKLISCMRVYDNNHIIFVEEVGSFLDYNTGKKYYPGENVEKTICIFQEEPNIVYEYHFYESSSFTHQGLMQRSSGIMYPDSSALMAENVIWKDSLWDIGSIKGDTAGQWKYLESGIYGVKDESVNIGYVSFNASGETSATIYYSNIIVKEYDENGKYVGNIYECDFSQKREMYAPNCRYEIDSVGGIYGNGCLKLDCIDKKAKVSMANSENKVFFAINPNHKYQICGYIKIKGEQSANASFTLAFNEAEKIDYYNKANLESKVVAYQNIAKKYNVPLFVGEFGTSIKSMEFGGVQWINDMLDVFDTYSVNYALHAYNDYNFGIIYGGSNTEEATYVNWDLVECLKKRRQ